MGFKWGEQLPRRPKATLPSLLFVLSRDLTLTVSLTLTLNVTLTLTQLTEETRRRRLSSSNASRPRTAPPDPRLGIPLHGRCRWLLPIVADGRCRSSSCFWWDVQLWTTNGKLYAPPFDAYRGHEVLPFTGERLSVVAQALCWTNPS